MNKKKKNLLIGGLLAIVLLLAVGYAAFATTLTINGTSSIDSRWDVHIKDNGVSYKNAVRATNVNAQKDSQLTASFECELTDPGVSTIDYDVIVENSGTFGAKLSSINLTGTTDYINATYSGMAVGDIIAAGGTDTLTVTVSYKDVSTVPTGEDATANITVTLNYTQDDGSSSGGGSSYTGTIYRNNGELLVNNQSINGQTTLWYSASSYSSAREAFETTWDYGQDESFCEMYGYDDCVSGTMALSAGNYITEDDYPTASARVQALGKSFYLKHIIVNDIVTESYTCFVYNGTERCLKGIDTDAYNDNKTLIEEYQSAANLNTIEHSNQSNPGCYYYNYGSCYCYGGPFYAINAYSYGGVNVNGSADSVCFVENDYGGSLCYGS